MTDDSEEWETPLNRQAFFALKNFSTDWRRDLVALLRSDDPIHPVVREVMAQAVEGETIDGTRLVLSGGGANADLRKGLEKRKRDLKVGAYMEALIAEGSTRETATEAASETFCVSFETCRAALTYSRNCEAWVEHSFNGQSKQLLDRASLRSLFHHNDMDDQRKKAGRTKRGNASKEL
ncbi:MAG: hypothetical protein ABJP70_00220 [Erythrobacter sp.]